MVENEGNVPPAMTGSIVALPSSSSFSSSSSSLVGVSGVGGSSGRRAGESDSDHRRRTRAEMYVRSGIADFAFEDHREDAVRAHVQHAATAATSMTPTTAAALTTTAKSRNKHSILTAGSGTGTRATNGPGEIELRFLEGDHEMNTVDFADGDRGEHKGEVGPSRVNASATAMVAAAAVPVNSMFYNKPDIDVDQNMDHNSASFSPSHSQTLTQAQVTKDGLPLLVSPTTGKVRVQLYELLRKRYITTSRDMKGFFFQIIFPAIQICLILAILTVTLNPAGHTVRLNASIYSKVRTLS